MTIVPTSSFLTETRIVWESLVNSTVKSTVRLNRFPMITLPWWNLQIHISGVPPDEEVDFSKICETFELAKVYWICIVSLHKAKHYQTVSEQVSAEFWWNLCIKPSVRGLIECVPLKENNIYSNDKFVSKTEYRIFSIIISRRRPHSARPWDFKLKLEKLKYRNFSYLLYGTSIHRSLPWEKSILIIFLFSGQIYYLEIWRCFCARLLVRDLTVWRCPDDNSGYQQTTGYTGGNSTRETRSSQSRTWDLFCEMASNNGKR